MNAHPCDGDPAQPAPARPSGGPGRAVERRWPLAGMQAGQIALIAATVYFAFGGGAAAVVRPPDDRGLGGFAIVVGAAAALLVGGLATLVVLHVRSLLALRATRRPTAGPATRAVLQRITEAVLIIPLAAAVSLHHLAYYPPQILWLVLLGLVLMTSLLLAHAHAAWIGNRIGSGGPHYRPLPPGGGRVLHDSQRGARAGWVLMIVLGVLLLLGTLGSEIRDNAAPWATMLQIVSGVLLVALPLRALRAVRRFRAALHDDWTDEHALAELSRRLVRSGYLGVVAAVVSAAAVVADPGSVLVAIMRTVLLVLVLSGAVVQLVLLTQVRLRLTPAAPH